MASRLASGPLLAVLLAALTFAAPARAARPSASARATARGLMDEGYDRRERGDLRGALESFRAADALVHAPTSALEVARVEESLGDLLGAREHLEALVGGVIELDEPREFTEARAAAARLCDDLDGRIPRLKVALDGPAREGATVTIDGEPIPRAALDAAHRLDPGAHVVVARTASGREARVNVTLRERESRQVTLAVADPPPAPEVPAAPLPRPAAVDLRVPSASRAPTPPRAPDRTVAYVAFGAAGAGLVVGVVSGVVALSHRDAAASSCVSGVCPPSSFHDLDAAAVASTVADVGFGVMLLGAGVGLADLLVTRGRDPVMARRVQPVVSLGGAGLRGTF